MLGRVGSRYLKYELVSVRVCTGEYEIMFAG